MAGAQIKTTRNLILPQVTLPITFFNHHPFFKGVLVTGYNTDKEVSKLDPNGPDYIIFAQALRKLDGLTANLNISRVETAC